MDKVIFGLLVLGTLGLFYVFVFRIAASAGEQYPANVRAPAIVAAVGILASGITEGLELFGILGGTTYLVALSLALVATLAAMGVLAIRL
jgi:hypothetical protein